MMSIEQEKEIGVNPAYYRKALDNVVFLARQSLPFSGNWVPAEKQGEAGAEMNSNFHQFFLLCALDDLNI